MLVFPLQLLAQNFSCISFSIPPLKIHNQVLSKSKKIKKKDSKLHFSEIEWIILLFVLEERMTGLQVWVCDGPGNCARCGNAAATPKRGWATVTCPFGGLTGDHVYTRQPNDYIQYCEIEVFGSRKLMFNLVLGMSFTITVV